MAEQAWQATVLTLFPGMFPGPLGESLAGKSLKEGIWALKTLDIRQFARDKHRTVDDVPLGGGVGMVLKPDVVAAALDHVADTLAHGDAVERHGMDGDLNGRDGGHGRRFLWRRQFRGRVRIFDKPLQSCADGVVKGILAG